MNRRHFILSGLSAGSLLAIAPGFAAPATTKEETCLAKMDQVTAEATYFSRYEHFHILAIPVSILSNPPADGFKTRTSTLDQDSLDEAAFAQFIKETGLDGDSLRRHSHEVIFTQQELERIASGEKEVKITVMTPKGNLAHHFFFTASRSAIVKIQRGRKA